MAASPLALTSEQVDAYLSRIGVEPRLATPDLSGLRALHLAHLERVPFENLDIVFAGGVAHDQIAALEKIVGDGARGGWCFELNGAVALLLVALGFDVRLLGAAVLLDGPSQVIEHLLLEVSAPGLDPHLVDVGFGESFDLPIALNTSGPQNGGSGRFELIASPQGTTLTRHVDGVPEALLRFKRVAHAFDDFAPVAQSLQTDPTKKWATHPFATRRLTQIEAVGLSNSEPSGTQRVTLTHDAWKIECAGVVDQRSVDRNRWDTELDRWFGITRPGPWPE